ncbi:MAG: YggS family pyridoxal phosphate-dependent enzyme [Verrucomicrobiales bacterium]|nr:YggS family pyridoxal phosphate-dependent enzyme [Verrucomicrobiales bacterium]MCP5559360.1 YggS family pyridoxal phosphate-dependent enzyme [Verrucomicrobiaceae bacterium]
MSSVAEHLAIIHTKIAAACMRSGRRETSVELMAVSKTFPPTVIQEAVDAGQTLFGENRVQEVLGKIPQLPSHLRWHLIGPLQSNKVRKILPHVEAIHSVGTLSIANDIQRIADELGIRPTVYLEINLADESTKHGFAVKDLPAQTEELFSLDRLEIQGLMCIPPFDPDPEKSRRYFTQLRQVRDQLEAGANRSLPGLSMGMSHDYHVAIEEGATIVRVGSAIFGGR